MTTQHIDPALVARRRQRRLARMPGENQIARQVAKGAPDLETAIAWARIDFADKCERWDRGEHYGSSVYGSAALRRDQHEQQALRRARENETFQKRHEEDARLDRAFKAQPHAWSN